MNEDFEISTIINLLNSGRILYFRLDGGVYCICKRNGCCNLSCWDGDDWVGSNIKEKTAIILLSQNYLTSSLQQVHVWIFGDTNDGHERDNS